LKSLIARRALVVYKPNHWQSSIEASYIEKVYVPAARFAIRNVVRNIARLDEVSPEPRT
jgi:hypothetical protein